MTLVCHPNTFALNNHSPYNSPVDTPNEAARPSKDARRTLNTGVSKGSGHENAEGQDVGDHNGEGKETEGKLVDIN